MMCTAVVCRTMPTLDDYITVLRIFQSARLRRDHDDLAMQPKYRVISEFFFTELYGPHDFNERDEAMRRGQQFLHLVPGVTKSDVEQALELLELTNALDCDLARHMYTFEVPLAFDESIYDHIYRQADNYDQRLRQLDLVRAVVLRLHRLSRIPFIDVALKHTRGAARLARFEALHHFLMQGCTALFQVRDASYFTDTIYTRELSRLNRIYQR